MKTKLNFFLTIPGVAVVTICILMVPLVAMQFTDEVNWSLTDFIIMGALIFITGISFVLITRYAANSVYKVAMGAAIGTTFLLIWVNLAVGLIGSGPNAANLMYIGVVAIVITGIFLSRFKAEGMQRAMFVTASVFVVVAIIQLIANMQAYASSSVAEVLSINSFFAMLYGIAGLLFRHYALEQHTEKSQA